MQLRLLRHAHSWHLTLSGVTGPVKLPVSVPLAVVLHWAAYFANRFCCQSKACMHGQLPDAAARLTYTGMAADHGTLQRPAIHSHASNDMWPGTPACISNREQLHMWCYTTQDTCDS